MLVTEQDRMREDIQGWVEEFGRTRTALMPILQGVQNRYGCVSDLAMQVVADQLGIHPVEVYGVVSFYAFLKEHKAGRYVIRLCQTLSCDMVGKERVARQLENDLGIRFGETTPDGKFSLEYASCLGMCDQGPAMLINDKVFTRVTPEMVHGIIEDYRSKFGAHALADKEGHAA